LQPRRAGPNCRGRHSCRIRSFPLALLFCGHQCIASRRRRVSAPAAGRHRFDLKKASIVPHVWPEMSGMNPAEAAVGQHPWSAR
jgi:hypothetical protein